MVTDPADTDLHARAAGARSVFYHGLAVLFQHPDQLWVDVVRDGKLFSALVEAAEALDQPAFRDVISRIETEFTRNEQSPETLSGEYVRLFGLHGGVNAPPFATEFGKHHAFSKAQDLADINGFYAAFGVELSTESADRPDHISFLCEFLSFLALKEVNAISEQDEEGLAVTTDAEKKFFCQFVINWVPVFCEALGVQARLGFYRELAALVKAFVEAEEKRFGVQIERVTCAEEKIDPDQETCVGCIDP